MPNGVMLQSQPAIGVPIHFMQVPLALALSDDPLMGASSSRKTESAAKRIGTEPGWGETDCVAPGSDRRLAPQ